MERQIVGRMRAKRLRERVKAATRAAGGAVRGGKRAREKEKIAKGKKGPDPTMGWGGSVGEPRWWCIGSLRSAEYVYMLYTYIFLHAGLYTGISLYMRVCERTVVVFHMRALPFSEVRASRRSLSDAYKRTFVRLTRVAMNRGKRREDRKYASTSPFVHSWQRLFPLFIDDRS